MEWLQVEKDMLSTMQKTEEEGNRKVLLGSSVP